MGRDRQAKGDTRAACAVRSFSWRIFQRVCSELRHVESPPRLVLLHIPSLPDYWLSPASGLGLCHLASSRRRPSCTIAPGCGAAITSAITLLSPTVLLDPTLS